MLDGTVRVNVGTVEMGQGTVLVWLSIDYRCIAGLNTKMTQIAAAVLKVTIYDL